MNYKDEMDFADDAIEIFEDFCKKYEYEHFVDVSDTNFTNLIFAALLSNTIDYLDYIIHRSDIKDSFSIRDVNNIKCAIMLLEHYQEKDRMEEKLKKL